MLVKISTADMQSSEAASSGDGLHERKPHKDKLGIMEEDESPNGNDSQNDPKKDKKTFGRTPGGVGKSTSFSICSQ